MRIIGGIIVAGQIIRIDGDEGSIILKPGKKYFISQDQRFRTDEALLNERSELVKIIEAAGSHVVDEAISIAANSQVFEDFKRATRLHHNLSLWFASRSLAAMAEADAIIFLPGYRFSRGCMVEYYAAQFYNLPMYRFIPE